MSDTVKILRPLFSRRREDVGGRVKHDSRGNGVRITTRADDAADVALSAELSVLEDEARPPEPAADAATQHCGQRGRRRPPGSGFD